MDHTLSHIAIAHCILLDRNEEEVARSLIQLES